jgi:VanZ family protein
LAATSSPRRWKLEGPALNSFLRPIAALLLIALLMLLLGPATTIEASRPGADKIAHFAAFGLVLWSFGVLFPRPARWKLALGAVAIGAAVEVVQGLTGRDAELLDFVADVLGVAAALLSWLLWRRFRPRASQGGRGGPVDRSAR